MNALIYIIIAILILSSSILGYLYYSTIRKYKDTNFTPFFMGRITPFTKENEDALSNYKSSLELVIQLLEYKLHAKVSDLVEYHENDKKANVCRGEINMLRILRTEFTSLKNKKLK